MTILAMLFVILLHTIMLCMYIYLTVIRELCVMRYRDLELIVRTLG